MAIITVKAGGTAQVINVQTTPTVEVVNIQTSGLQGPRGLDGSKILSGNRPPIITDGVDGDYWLYKNSGTARLYGPKLTQWSDYVDLNGTYEPIYLSFNHGNLLGNRYLLIDHNYNATPNWQMKSNLSDRIMPDLVEDINRNTIRFDLISFVPITGNWEVIIWR